jgi:PBP1b-binding outer membrane lipoprotein LpoB
MTKTSRLTLFLTTTLILSGCVYAPVPELPELPVLSVPECPEVKPAEIPALSMPDPIPKNLYLDIQDGKVIKADEGGEQLIRQYAATRKAIKQWAK